MDEKKNGVCTVESKLSITYLEKLSLEVREVSENVTKTLPNIANPHIGIYREIGQQVLASIEETQTHRQKYFIYRITIGLKVIPSIKLLHFMACNMYRKFLQDFFCICD